MLTGTSELGIKALVVIGLESRGQPVSPGQLCERFECSRSYLSKILGMLVKAGLLRSFRGARGGVLLARPPEEISLMDIVEACQGLLVGNYCRSLDGSGMPTCAFHLAMEDVYRATREALTRWSLADLMRRPTPAKIGPDGPPCKMEFKGWEKYLPAEGMERE